MRLFTDKKIIKVISSLLIILIIFSFVNPIITYAEDEDEQVGGKLFKPIFKLFAGVGDLLIQGLQQLFIGDSEIKGDGINEIEQEGAFLIRYGPAVIFSNKVPGLNANFIEPSNAITAKNETISWEEIETNININEIPDNCGFDFNKVKYTTTITDNEWYTVLNAKEHVIMTWMDDNGDTYKFISTEITSSVKDEVQSLIAGGMAARRNN